MTLDELTAANRKFLSGPRPPELDHAARKGLAVVACMDAGLVALLEPALGLGRGDAVILKNAGNRVSEDVLRSLAVAVYLQGIKTVLVVGHTDCAMSRLDTVGFTTAVAERRRRREDIPTDNLPGWLGAFASLGQNVREGVGTIRRAGFLPADLEVLGVVIDTVTGEITPVSVEPEAGV